MRNVFCEIKKDFSLKFFFYFLLFSGIMWVLIPTSYYEALHYDPAETLMWGSTFNLGNAKHPPMAGYMLYWFCSLFRFHNFSVFLLSQIVVTIGFVYIYRLSRCFFERPQSVMATLIITFYFLYNYETPKFNANVPHILFVPMMCYYFYKGITENKLNQWLLLAVSGACAFLTKYYAGIFFLSFLAYMVYDKNTRLLFKSCKPYLAGGLFFLLITPHLYHLWQTDFSSFEYIAEGKIKQYSYFFQIFAILFSIAAPILCMSAAAVLTYCLTHKKLPGKIRCFANPAAAKYAGFIMGGQAAILLLMALANQRLEMMWTFQLFLPAGILIMSVYPAEVDRKTIINFAVLVFAFASVVMIVDLLHSNFSSSFRRHLNPDELRRTAEKYYYEQTGKREIPFITGDVWHTSILQKAYHYQVKAAPAHDKILLDTHRDIIRRHGALVISARNEESAGYLKKNIGQSPDWTFVLFPYKAKYGKMKKHDFYFGIIKPENYKK